MLIAGVIDSTAADGAFIPKVAQAWADKINANGGINGHPVSFDFADTKGDAATAQSQIAALATKNPLMWLLASPGTETATAEAMGSSGIPILGVGYNPAVWGGSIEAFKLASGTGPGAAVACALPNAFPITTTFGAVVDDEVLGAKAAGATKLTTAACAEVDSCPQADPILSADAKALGLPYTGLVKISSTAADYGAECIKFVHDHVDFVQIIASGSVGATMWANCKVQGFTGTFGASAGSVSGDILKVQGIKLAGGLNAFPWWVDDAPVKKYRDVMTAG